MQYQDPNLFIYQLTYLPFTDVVSMYSINKRYHEICYNSNHKYDVHWRNLIESTFSSDPNYKNIIKIMIITT